MTEVTNAKAVCDRGYVGVKEALGAMIILPKKALKRDNRYQRDKIETLLPYSYCLWSLPLAMT
jgi:hypothetical protein